jgi:GDP-4-dehydro-6-deoxy-D-mannose reductase
MRILVTGSEGFAGTHLVKALEADGHEVSRFDLRRGDDIRDYERIRTATEAASPDEIYHLAALAWPAESLWDPRRAVDVNTTGTLNLLEAVRCAAPGARVLLAGTSEEYGYEGHERLAEDSPCRPTTPYGVSKLAATTMGMVYARRHGLHVVATRAFNHTGWGRQAVNAESAFARRIVAAERGEAGHVPHGDLSAVRDFTAVTDVIAAYRLAITLEPGIFNVCSGRPVSLREVMGILTGLSVLDYVPLKEDPSLGRRDRGRFPQASAARLRAAGWEPAVPLESALADVLAYWRSR